VSESLPELFPFIQQLHQLHFGQGGQAFSEFPPAVMGGAIILVEL
jgi:hypothetical protein